MRFAPVKTSEQQDLQMLHRTRDRLFTQRTGLINHIYGLLGEYGVVIPAGAFQFRKDIRNAVAEAKLSDLAKQNFNGLIAEFEALDKHD
jgi:transposase